MFELYTNEDTTSRVLLLVLCKQPRWGVLNQKENVRLAKKWKK